MTRLGLTGGIASGKSTVARMLAAHGATVIDADAISRSVTAAGGAAIEAIRAAFGPTFITPQGELDRARMRELAFSDPAARERLQAIVHPLVQAGMLEAAAAAQGPCTVFEIPLLVESRHWRQGLDRILVVDCSEATQLQRVMERNQWTREVAQAVIDAQAPRLTRLQAADIVVFNDGLTLQALEGEVAQAAHLVGL
ncbi:MAG: dephospho-CoA kinase [Ramlibacter sp.]|jgi:dephospho-CoA kinase|nr:dephospho-CoA kinase [Ramlibacter sp.]